MWSWAIVRAFQTMGAAAGFVCLQIYLKVLAHMIDLKYVACNVIGTYLLELPSKETSQVSSNGAQWSLGFQTVSSSSSSSHLHVDMSLADLDILQILYANSTNIKGAWVASSSTDARGISDCEWSPLQRESKHQAVQICPLLWSMMQHFDDQDIDQAKSY